MVAETPPVLWANAGQVFQFSHWKRGCWNILFTATLNWDGGEQWVYREDSLHFKSKRELLISSSQMAMQIKLRSLWDHIYAAFLRPSNWLLSKNRWTKLKGKALSTSLLPASLTSILSNYRGDEIQELFFFFSLWCWVSQLLILKNNYIPTSHHSQNSIRYTNEINKENEASKPIEENTGACVCVLVGGKALVKKVEQAKLTKKRRTHCTESEWKSLHERDQEVQIS